MPRRATLKRSAPVAKAPRVGARAKRPRLTNKQAFTSTVISDEQAAGGSASGQKDEDAKVITLGDQQFLLRSMHLKDAAECFSVGQNLFTSQLASTLYRTWDEYNLVEALYTTPEFCLVAQNITQDNAPAELPEEKDSKKVRPRSPSRRPPHPHPHMHKSNIVGFVLACIARKANGPPTGYVEWVGIRPSYQRKGLGTALVKEAVRRMFVEEEGHVAQVIADTPLVNTPALGFFKHLHFGMPEPHVYMHMNLEKPAASCSPLCGSSLVPASPAKPRRSPSRSTAGAPSFESGGKPPACVIKTREIRLDDLYNIYELGVEVYAAHSTLQRIWSEDEVTSFFLTDSEYCMVAETKEGELAGFVLGEVIWRPRWHYGYVAWMGVNPHIQRGGVGRALFEAFRAKVIEEGANMLLVDTQKSNAPAIAFFQKLGFKEDEDSAHCYFTMETKGGVEP